MSGSVNPNLKMPPVTDSYSEAQQHLEDYGLALIGDALTPEQIEAAKARLMEQAEAEKRAGIAVPFGTAPNAKKSDGGVQAGENQVVGFLHNKGDIFRDILQDHPILDLVRNGFRSTYEPVEQENLPPRFQPYCDAGDFLLSSYAGIIMYKAGLGIRKHPDQNYVPGCTPYPMVYMIMWMLSDYTAENGGTQMAPRSHKEPHQAKFWTNPPEMTPAIAPAGTAMIFDGRTWHASGGNTTDQPRIGLLSYFCRPFMRQQSNMVVSTPPEILEKCSPEWQAMLGYKNWFSLGQIERQPPFELMTHPQTHVTEMHV